MDWVELLTKDGVAELVLGGVALLFSLLVKLEWVRKHNLEMALASLEAGVSETYEEYVKVVKESRRDGKLTEDEKRTARVMAVEKAKSILATQGLNLFKYYGPRVAEALVSRISQRSKTLGALASPLLEPELDMD